MKTVCQYQEGGRWTSNKKQIEIENIQIYLLKDIFKTQLDIHNGVSV